MMAINVKGRNSRSRDCKDISFDREVASCDVKIIAVIQMGIIM